MARLLPPLRALQAFDAVARHRSFSRAANELHVTQSAVSHQIRQLEDWLGKPLFLRRGRTLALTEVGDRYAQAAQCALAGLAAATAQVLGKPEGIMRLAVYSSFAIKWLIPRLPDFRARYPSVDLRLSMVAQDPDLGAMGADAAITSQSQVPGYVSQHLLSETWFPVCAPALFQSMDRSRLGEELFRLPLLSLADLHPVEEWRRWCDAAGLTWPARPTIYYFSHVILALQAAIEGQGIALGMDFLVAGDIAAGRLVKPTEAAFSPGFDYYLCYRESRRSEAGIQALSQWLASVSVPA